MSPPGEAARPTAEQVAEVTATLDHLTDRLQPGVRAQLLFAVRATGRGTAVSDGTP